MTKTKYPEGFLSRVGEWVDKYKPAQRPRSRKEDTAPVKVIEVIEYGTDWAGDSFEGFRSEFYVEVVTDKDSIHVEGEELGSLWRYVMTGWGA